MKKAYAILPRINTKWNRVKTINLLIIAKLWNLATVQEVSDMLLSDIERTIFKLIWTKIKSKKININSPHRRRRIRCYAFKSQNQSI
jgi:hypothetical protein